MNNKQFIRIKILIAIAVSALFIWLVTRVLERVKAIAPKVVCGTNLVRLNSALRQYAGDYDGRYPSANKWCDLLVEHANVPTVLFFCKSSGDDQYHVTDHPIDEANLPADMVFQRDYNDYEGRLRFKYWIKRAHYGMNPNAEPNSPGDIVLLFETKAGWNQFGGPEMLSTENHFGDGCSMLFNNGRVKRVKAKDIGKLKWK
ncbi:MAG: hypothetical protein ACYTEL_21830 [Planctomycetota bacterium]|jgi:hypothetical protein